MQHHSQFESRCWQYDAGTAIYFFKSLVKISRSLIYFEIFIANKEEGVSRLFVKILLKKKKLSNQKSRCARIRHCYAMPILLCFSGVFLHCKNVFISHIWEVNNCTAWVKPVLKLQWNSLNFIKTLWRKTAEIKETQNVVSSLQDVYTTSLDFS